MNRQVVVSKCTRFTDDICIAYAGKWNCWTRFIVHVFYARITLLTTIFNIL